MLIDSIDSLRSGRLADCQSAIQQINNLRYDQNVASSAWQARSADWQSAVSRIGNPRIVQLFKLRRPIRVFSIFANLADCQSAIQQINNPRYDQNAASSAWQARSADWQSAVSRIGNPRIVQLFKLVGPIRVFSIFANLAD
jgi:hypothetical protein